MKTSSQQNIGWPYIKCNCSGYILSIQEYLFVMNNKPDITIHNCDCYTNSRIIKSCDEVIKLQNLMIIKDIIE